MLPFVLGATLTLVTKLTRLCWSKNLTSTLAARWRVAIMRATRYSLEPGVCPRDSLREREGVVKLDAAHSVQDVEQAHVTQVAHESAAKHLAASRRSK